MNILDPGFFILLERQGWKNGRRTGSNRKKGRGKGRKGKKNARISLVVY
jgi:hypothetical protein